MREGKIYMKKLWNLYRHSLWWMSGIFVITMLITVGYLFKTPSTYQATAQLLTRGDMSQFPVYRKLLTGNPSFREPLDQRLLKANLLANRDEITGETYTLTYAPADPVFSITAVSTDANKAAKIANVTAKYFARNVGNFTTKASIQVITPAQKPLIAYAPQKKKTLFFGLIMGLFLSFTFGTVRGLFFGKVTDDFIESNVDGKLLGVLDIYQGRRKVK